jgi:hypothetical protein
VTTPPDPPTPLVGALRDAVATTNALLLLLRSRNVAPKAIAQLLPSLQGSFHTLSGNYDLLTSALRGDRERTDSLRSVPTSFAELGPLLHRQVDAFNAAVDLGSQQLINAKARLTLEQSVLQISQQLTALLALFELWSDTLRPRAALDLVELLTLSRFGDQPPLPHRQVLHLKLYVETEALPLAAPPRAVLNWLALAASLLASERDPSDLGLTLLPPTAAQQLVFGFRKETTQNFLALQLPALSPKSQANMLDAVRNMGLLALRTEGGFAFSWSN